MKSSLHAVDVSGRRLAAAVCLLAVLVMWAPLWAAALSASGIGCCDGAMCPAHGHSPAKNGVPASAPAQSEQPMQCDHENHGDSMMNCGISCYHEQAHTFVASVQFVMPSPTVLLQPQQAVSSVRALEVAHVLSFFDPLAPPPRTVLLSL
jgi:hypothetical protein